MYLDVSSVHQRCFFQHLTCGQRRTKTTINTNTSFHRDGYRGARLSVQDSPLFELSTDFGQDVSDAQYSSFRGNVLYLAILLVLHPLLRRIYGSLKPLRTQNGISKSNGSSTYISAADGEARMEQRASFDFGFGLIFLVALHGFSAFKILIILYINFCIPSRLPRKYIPAATWIFNIATLFANELADGYKFTKIAAYLSPVVGVAQDANWGTTLDSYGGIMSRWEILFNITVLRLISFNMDYYFSLNMRGGSPVEVGLSANVYSLLILIRRNNSTLPTPPKGIALQHPRMPKNTTFAITLHTPFTLHSISPDPLSHSTTTSRSSNTHPQVPSDRELSSTASASSSACSPWSFFYTMTTASRSPKPTQTGQTTRPPSFPYSHTSAYTSSG